MKTRLLYLLLVLLLFNVTSVLAGTTYTWAGGASGNWTTATNWSPNSGYPGKTGTTDIAIFNTSTVTATLTSTITIATLQTTSYGISGITVSVSSGATLNIGSGVSTAQPSSAATVFTFAGAGTTKISGTITAGYNASFAISSGATVYFNANAIFDEATGNPHGNLTNAGTLNILTGASCKFADFASLVNSGTIHSYGATFTFSGSGSPYNTYNNTGTVIDHGSTMTFSGSNSNFLNSGSSSVATLHGETITFSGSNPQYITNAGTMTIDSTSSITIGTYQSYITNTGTFYAGTSNSPCTITLSGQSATITNTKTFKLGSTSVIAPSGTTATITNTSPGVFTLQSDANGSATISTFNATAGTNGTFNVERFITGGNSYVSGRWVYRNYRMMSSQVNEGKDGNGNWPYSLNYLGASTIITDCVSTYATKGGNPSLYVFNETYTPSDVSFISGNWIGVTNISNTAVGGHISTTDATNASAKIYQGAGFLMFFRGDNVNNLSGTPSKTTYPYVAPENVTFTAVGNLNYGNISVVSWTGYGGLLYTNANAGNATVRGFNMVGNPYASTIDWSTFSNTVSNSAIYGANVNPTAYILNPTNSNYDSYNAQTGMIVGSGSKYIPSGQGFFVQSNNHSSALTFTELAKTNTQVTGSNLLLGTPDAQKAYTSYFHMRLVTDTINYDEMAIGFNSTSTSTFNPQEDSEFLPGAGAPESLMSISSDNVKASVKWLPLPTGKITSVSVKLNALVTADGIYQLKRTDLKAIPQLFDIWLMDNYKKDSLDIRHNTTYSFNVMKSDTSSFGANRFSLIIRQNPGYAYRLLNFTASKVTAATPQVQLAWVTENEQNYTNFTVERSTDNGKTFDVVGGLIGSATGNYSLADKNPANGTNLYRLKSTDINNNVTYSYILPISYTNLSNSLVKNNINVYPNPASSTLNLAINAGTTIVSNYNIQITNSSGIVMKQGKSAQTNWQTNVNDLLPGTYIIKVFKRHKWCINWRYQVCKAVSKSWPSGAGHLFD